MVHFFSLSFFSFSFSFSFFFFTFTSLICISIIFTHSSLSIVIRPTTKGLNQNMAPLNTSLKGKNVLVTGGAGFIGSHVVDRAMEENAAMVVVVDNLYCSSAYNFQHHTGKSNFKFVHHDVTAPLPEDLTIGMKFDVIFHLACAASPVHYQNEPIQTTLTCVNGTYHMLKLATAHNCPILISSTSEVYGDPLEHPQKETYWGNVHCNGIRSCYDEGKRCAESLCFDFHRRYQTKIRVVRIFNTYGPRMALNDGRIISNFLVQALEGKDITIYGDGKQSRSFQFVEDLIEGFWRFVAHPTEIGPINMGNPEEYTVKEMAEKILALVPGSGSKIVYLDAVQDDPKQRRPDNSKAKAILDWQPHIPVADGLRRTLEEFADRLSLQSVSGGAGI